MPTLKETAAPKASRAGESMKVGPINSEVLYRRAGERKGRIRLPKLQPPKLGAHCGKGNCPGCYVLSCSCECHRRQA